MVCWKFISNWNLIFFFFFFLQFSKTKTRSLYSVILYTCYSLKEKKHPMQAPFQKKSFKQDLQNIADIFNSLLIRYAKKRKRKWKRYHRNKIWKLKCIHLLFIPYQAFTHIFHTRPQETEYSRLRQDPAGTWYKKSIHQIIWSL